MGILLTQMLATIGIEKHGEKTLMALLKKFQQLNDGALPGKPVVYPVYPTTLYVKEIHGALNVVTIIKEKKWNIESTSVCRR